MAFTDALVVNVVSESSPLSPSELVIGAIDGALGEILSAGTFDRIQSNLDNRVATSVRPKSFSANSLTSGGIHREYYGLVHLDPEEYIITSVQVGINYSFTLWNAVLAPNTLNTIVEAGSAGTQINFTAPIDFKSGEYRADFFAEILATADPEILTTYTFVFDSGSVVFSISTFGSEPFLLKPEPPFEERIQYKTDIITSYNGTEQRITTRINPKQVYRLSTILNGHDDIREYNFLLMTTYPRKIVVPLYNQRAGITQEILAGENEIHGDFSDFDFYDGCIAIVQNSAGDFSELVEVISQTTIKLTLRNDMNDPFDIKSSVFLSEECFIKNNQSSGLRRVNAGAAAVVLTEANMRPLIGRGGVVNTFDSVPILEPTPYADRAVVSEKFSKNIEDLSTQNVNKFDTFDLFTKHQSEHVFKISNRTELQYWYRFIDHVKGARVSFLISTERHDLQVDSNTDAQITVTPSGHYDVAYDSIDTYSRIRVDTDAGPINTIITGVTVLPDRRVQLAISPSLVNTAEGKTINKISFLNRVRMADSITFSHYAIHSTVAIKVRTTEQ